MPKRIGERASIDCGGFLQCHRDRPHKTFHQENTHRQPECDVREQQCIPLVGHPAAAKHDINRYQQRVNRDQHPHQEHHVKRPVHFKTHARQNIADNKAEQHNRHDRNSCRPNAVPHRFSEMIVFVCQDPDVIDQRRILRKTDDICVKHPFFLQGGIEHPDDREDAGR